MKSEDMRIALINSAIHTISQVGIDHATTKLLSSSIGVNEVYIYRIFGGKEELFRETFKYIDKEFSAKLLQLIPTMYNPHADIKQRFKNYFYALWQYILEDKEKYTFFIRYYYSRCYTTNITNERKNIYAGVMEKFNLVFSYGTDTWWLFSYILDVLFSSAVKVLREEIPNNEETAEKIFELLFAALQSHLKQI